MFLPLLLCMVNAHLSKLRHCSCKKIKQDFSMPTLAEKKILNLTMESITTDEECVANTIRQLLVSRRVQQGV